jgi:hypothetical protein
VISKNDLFTESYTEQIARWPKSGRYILAQFDTDSIVVYQAYNTVIGHFAAQHGYFGEGFSFTRMSWIKPNFLWMMYRCGLGLKVDQEVVLAIHIARKHFEQLLIDAVHSSFVAQVYETQQEWQEAVKRSSVRLQWDPDHHPSGATLDRKAIQLGLRGPILTAFAKEWIVRIEDISEFVREQHNNAKQGHYDQLMLPREDIYPIVDEALSLKLGLAKNT